MLANKLEFNAQARRRKERRGNSDYALGEKRHAGGDKCHLGCAERTGGIQLCIHGAHGAPCNHQSHDLFAMTTRFEHRIHDADMFSRKDAKIAKVYE